MSWKYRKHVTPRLAKVTFYLMLVLFSMSTLLRADETPSTISNTEPPIIAVTQAQIALKIHNNATKLKTTSATVSTISSSLASTSELSNSALISSTTFTPDGALNEDSNSNGNKTNDICVHGIKSILMDSENERPIIKSQQEIVKIIEGDVILSVLTIDPISAMFVVNRMNVAYLLEADFEIGIRAIHLDNEQVVENLLIQEVQYQQHCLTYAIGIFIDYDYYKLLESVIKDLEYNIWPIPSVHSDIFPKVSHLLYQMPWGDQLASVEIFTENLQIYNDFMESARREHMCLMHFKSEHNIYILIGNDMMKNFKENGIIFVVPTERIEKSFIAGLPDKTFILMEKEIDLKVVDYNSSEITLDKPLIGERVLPSRVLVLARPLLEIIHWLKRSLQKHCRRVEGTFVLESCSNFLQFISEDWQKPEYHLPYHYVPELMNVLRMRRLTPFMSIQMLQKLQNEKTAESVAASSKEELSTLREIASQNFVTNVTTYYHYNPENHTSLELKTKFGEVFNCKFSANENPRYPFLFDGESVMFWRIKSDTWVATGITAAILGVICTVAILVFILVRISLGDVFEGNPVTSVLLLLSLLLMFTSFVPFSMEYVGERHNSHVTYEDAKTLTTLCAVRVFILTLIYCFVFSLLLCRAVMLASIGSEGGFLSHVNGYIQAVICVLSVFVQLGMSIQLLVIMHMSSDSISCENIYYGYWFFGLLAYDAVLLLACIALVPLIYRSQRNYREGILIVIGCILLVMIWIVWITVACFGDDLRDAAIPLGLQACGWAILVGILIPRTFLIVRGIERSDIAQALPSLTSLAFAQNNQYSSEQSVYECVNPAMRNFTQDEDHHYNQSPSEMPTLPLRGGVSKRQQFFANLRQSQANGGGVNRQNTTRVQRGSPTHSYESSLPPSPENNKITRF